MRSERCHCGADAAYGPPMLCRAHAIDRLERMSDALDFHDLNIVEIREALRRAFEAGRESVSS